ncbi:D-amino acid dehydrogenase [Pseudomonas fluorescens]|uniref:D-amino acid dehydrogenase n=1 Tax=Pseudomonas fluorescens TaxID=294 RepID=UPI0017867920|nr:D-amino acid dehydrogenase [Pseudomonas fluorescens]MBD8149233.1 D-amino acid dehydrogenase [Pseudomonas fluorescens]MBD8178722.1 D-amino acid dehydrogenase [Pseudomonas fluorescens]MBD8747997.1 D-amino acid dehydrogenase [Pseudomonas fluorescens]MBD8752072.1 D-amino acid dehydrogenase [Pseudomonas fluorescens]MBD8761492.1 D-amino acid dehydrogenase [Pseudomonas fluorescens]
MAAQVCIIGGGVIGLASAYALVRAGHAVTVIDARDSLGSETSFANGGQLSYRYVAPLADAGVPLQAIGWLLRGDSPLKLRPRLDPRQWRWMAAFMAACRGSVNKRNAAHLLRLAFLSQATLQQWRIDDRLEGFDWRRNGKLVTFRTANSFEHARSKVTDMLQQQVLSMGDCARLEPALAAGDFVGGIYTPNEEVADCHAFCQRLAARLEASGRCTFMLGRKVTGIRHADGAVQAIELGGEVMPVEQLVLAAGHRSAELGLPGLALALYPLKGYSLSVPIGAQHRAPNLSITDYDRKIVYARIGEQLRVAAMVDIVGFDTGLEPKRLALMKRQALETFPLAGDYTHAVEWAGMRPATPTGVPLIGASRYRNLWLNLGHGALGFTLACGSGQLLAELIDQRTPSIDMQGLAPCAA